jgi:hypothetical protein
LSQPPRRVRYEGFQPPEPQPPREGRAPTGEIIPGILCGERTGCGITREFPRIAGCVAEKMIANPLSRRLIVQSGIVLGMPDHPLEVSAMMTHGKAYEEELVHLADLVDKTARPPVLEGFTFARCHINGPTDS